MTVTDMLDSVLEAIGEALDRIGLAFGRTFGSLVDGAFAGLMMWDIGIVLATVFVVLCALLLLREVLDTIHLGAEWLLELVHKIIEGILDGFHGVLKGIVQLIRKGVKR